MQDTSVSNPEPREESRAPGLWAAIFTWAGALASIALIVGVAMWTYRLGLRDAMDVPIIQAMAGPSKIVPEDRGGKVVPHQGLAVNEVLAGNGSQKIAGVKTAPEGSGLSDEDEPRMRLARLENVAKPSHRPMFKKAPQPVLQAQNAVAENIDPLGGIPKTAHIELPNLDGTEPFEVKMDDIVIEPVRKAKVNTGPAQVLNPVAPDAAPKRAEEPEVVAPEPKVEVAVETPEPDQEPKLNVEQALAEVQTEDKRAENVEIAALSIQEISTSKFAPERSAAPKPRTRLRAAAKVEPVAVEAAVKREEKVASREPDVGDDVKPGTRMVQLGAYGSEAIAKRQWDVIVSRNSDLLGAKSRYIQRTRSNGKTFYRLRATSFDSLASSRAACSALSARGIPCIPTVHK